MTDSHHLQYMARALKLAAGGLYTADPNPRVGCVIVRNEHIAGEGFHERAGEPHAEVHALMQAGEQAKGSTVYVTLEPCSYYGRTPACAEALIKADVARVFVAMEDPNPRVSGRGIEALRQSGIEVNVGLLAEQAEALNCGFVKRMRDARPWIRIKAATSLDGRTALASGESQWISGDASRRDVQLLRARCSAIMTGIGTALADDPSLNVRLSSSELGITGEVRQPARIILDTELRTPARNRFLVISGETLIMTCSEDKRRIRMMENAGAEVTVLPVDPVSNSINLRFLMHELARREINEVQVEAGSRLTGPLLEQGLVDELVIYIAPHLMGENANGLARLPGIRHMSDRYRLQFQDVRRVGEDIRITARPVTATD